MGRVLLVVGLLAIGLTACGQSGTTMRPHDPAAVVRLLEHDGYKAPEAPKPPLGTRGASAEWSVRLDTRYGKPMAYLTRAGLYVVVVSGTSRTVPLPVGLPRR